MHTDEYDKKYNLVYSSRTVIKNQYINKKQKPGGYYSDDVWGYWAKKLDGLIPQDYCIYCEIAGFTPNGSPIQKGYDYGCTHMAEEKSKLMVYRITKDGKELEISEVIEFGKYLSEKLGDIIMPLTLLYHGSLGDLYPELDRTNHWHENLLENNEILQDLSKDKSDSDYAGCEDKLSMAKFALEFLSNYVPQKSGLKAMKEGKRELS